MLNKEEKPISNKEAVSPFFKDSLPDSTLALAMKSFSSIAKKIAPVIVFGSVSLVITSSIIGFSIQSLVKLFIIIEFTALLPLFNVKFDLVLQLFLDGIYNLANIDILDFPTEQLMQSDVANSVAS